MGSNRTADVQSSEVGKTIVQINTGSRYEVWSYLITYVITFVGVS